MAIPPHPSLAAGTAPAGVSPHDREQVAPVGASTMPPSAIDRRRSRRADVDGAITLQLVKEGTLNALLTGQVRNVSLDGVLCHVKAPCELTKGDHVNCSLSIPQEQSRFFPFSRLLGQGVVVRVEPVISGRRAGETLASDQVVGLAVAFAPNVTALGTIDQD